MGYFGNEQEERIAAKGIRRLMPTDWKTGEALWLIDFVVPFGGREKMVEELRLKIPPGKRMKMLQAKPEGGTGVVRKFMRTIHLIERVAVSNTLKGAT